MSHVPEGIILSESGILQQEGIYFYSPSEFARENLFYLMWGAKYLCDAPYQVRQRTFDAFLFFYISSGELEFTYREQRFTAKQNDIVLLDCKHVHEYSAKAPVRFTWFHFRGGASQAYCDQLWKQTGAHFPNHPTAEPYFQYIHQLLQQQTGSDDMASIYIHRLLGFLNLRPVRRPSPAVAKVQNYIAAHYGEDLSIDDLAAQAALSRYHFSRIFRQEVGTSPHAYLLEVRLRNAKRMLLETDFSIEEISRACAFCSASNFIRTFRQSNGLTPAKFRQMFRA